jgi:hypothetical protein
MRTREGTTSTDQLRELPAGVDVPLLLSARHELRISRRTPDAWDVASTRFRATASNGADRDLGELTMRTFETIAELQLLVGQDIYERWITVTQSGSSSSPTRPTITSGSISTPSARRPARSRHDAHGFLRSLLPEMSASAFSAGTRMGSITAEQGALSGAGAEQPTARSFQPLPRPADGAPRSPSR